MKYSFLLPASDLVAVSDYTTTEPANTDLTRSWTTSPNNDPQAHSEEPVSTAETTSSIPSTTTEIVTSTRASTQNPTTQHSTTHVSTGTFGARTDFSETTVGVVAGSGKAKGDSNIVPVVAGVTACFVVILVIFVLIVFIRRKQNTR